MTNSPGSKIKYLRSLTGMSQEELGRRVGVQRAAINKYEKGSVTNIPITTIEKIAKVFDVSPTFLVGWNETTSNPLASETKVLQGVKTFYGPRMIEVMETYTHLTPEGKQRVDQYLHDIDLLYAEDTIDVD